MKIKNWNRLVVAGIVSSLGFVVSFNYLVDPYEIFHTKKFKMSSATNERFNKYEYLSKNGNGFDVWLMGSSVMGAYEPTWLEEGGYGKAYNASFLGGLPSDAGRVLSALSVDGVKPKTVFMGIDLFPFLQAEDSRSPSKTHHYKVTGENELHFFGSYLFASSLWHGGNKIRESYSKIDRIKFDIEGTGRYYLLSQDAERTRDLDAYTQKNFGAKKVSEIKVKEIAWIEKRFDELRDLKEWGDKNDVKFVFYIHPFHRLLRDNLPQGALESFRERIFGIVGVIPDFTDRRDLTDNDKLYYDPKHYISDVAKEITKEVTIRRSAVSSEKPKEVDA